MSSGYEVEEEFWKKGFRYVAGVDEVGRGACAGPVVAACVVLDRRLPFEVRDSKELTPRARCELARKVMRNCVCWSAYFVGSELVDQLSINRANLEAMCGAVRLLALKPDVVIADFYEFELGGCPVIALRGADKTCASVSAASIVAKVLRDRVMEEFAKTYSLWDFAANKGYLTASHLERIKKFGLSPIHRKSFRIAF